MKRLSLLLIAATMFVAWGYSETGGEITMSGSVKCVSISLKGSGTATVDWGEGSEKRIVNLDVADEYGWVRIERMKLDTIFRTITITGENITGCRTNSFAGCNQFTRLDVSRNTALTFLDVKINKLTKLDVSRNAALEYLDCSDNQLTELDVNKNTALIYLDCGQNQLTELDVSKNIALTYLKCRNNQLTALDVSRNFALIGLFFCNNQLTALDMSRNTALRELYCMNNQLTALDVSRNTALAGWFYCNGNQLSADALNFLFGTLHDNIVTYEDRFGIEKISPQNIFIDNNPGSEGCDRSIAESKGWTVRNFMEPVETYRWELDCPKSGDVYVAGIVDDVATVWKNGVAQNLIGTGNKRKAYVYSVYVSGSDVYVAGTVDGVATVWKNGKPQYLTGNILGSVAYSVYVSGSDVYVAGAENSGGFMPLVESTGRVMRYSVATLWKNGLAQNLSDGADIAAATSVYVSGNDVYVAGTEGFVVTVWKNGETQNLSQGDANSMYSVCVSSEDVYVAGIRKNINIGYSTTVWKNGEAQNLILSGGSYNDGRHSVFVSDGDVYVAASSFDKKRDLQIATLWKNGKAQYLTDITNNDSSGESVYVSGGDVYVAGYDSEKALLWKNGVVQNLGNGQAYSVFVVE